VPPRTRTQSARYAAGQLPVVTDLAIDRLPHVTAAKAKSYPSGKRVATLKLGPMDRIGFISLEIPIPR
jgi:hypothetical protein